MLNNKIMMGRAGVKVAIVAIFFLCHGVANAGEQIGRIATLLVRASDGLVSVELEGTHAGKPACAIYDYWMIREEASVFGKQQYAMLLSAKLAGKSIKIIGSNQCVRWLDGEDIDAIFLLD